MSLHPLAARFAEGYIFRRGYRGRRYGLAVALLSWCYWMVTELKVWERQLATKPPTLIF